jgi:glucan phosphoethanolaminetransferase (alkaline phosphatase superfamily)
MDFAVIARVAKIIAVVGFLLPWVTYSCAGQHFATLSGVDLATGQFTVHNTANGAAEHHSVSPNLWLIAALVVIALGLLAGFIVKGSNAVNLMLASSLGALALSFGGMQVAHNRDQHQVSANNAQQLDQATLAAVQIDNQYGYYITLLSLAGAAGACVLSFTVGRARAPAD